MLAKLNGDILVIVSDKSTQQYPMLTTFLFNTGYCFLFYSAQN